MAIPGIMRAECAHFLVPSLAPGNYYVQAIHGDPIMALPMSVPRDPVNAPIRTGFGSGVHSSHVQFF